MIMIGSVPAVKPAESVQPAKLFALCFSHCVIGVLAMRAVVAEAPTPFERVLLGESRQDFFSKQKNTCQTKQKPIVDFLKTMDVVVPRRSVGLG